MSAPDITILMPMLNAERFIREALMSVLASRSVSLEVVVIDDGSTDDSRAVVQEIDDQRIRLIDGPRTGIADALNAGVAVARGRWLARCDGDDLFPPERLAAQQAWLAAHPDFGAVCGGFATMTERGRFMRDMACGTVPEEITGELRSGHTRTSLCTWLVKTELVQQSGGCRAFFKIAEDIDLQLRLGELCRVWFDPARTYHYRFHETSATHTCRSALRVFYHATACRLQQQRLTGALDDLQKGQIPAVPTDVDDTVLTADHHTQKVLIGAAWDHQLAGRRGMALKTALRACLAHPMNINAWRSFGALAFRGPRS